jgi:hypothetical protein
MSHKSAWGKRGVVECLSSLEFLEARFWITSVADDSTTLGGAHLLPRSSCVKDKPPSDKRFQHSNLADLLGHN